MTDFESCGYFCLASLRFVTWLPTSASLHHINADRDSPDICFLLCSSWTWDAAAEARRQQTHSVFRVPCPRYKWRLSPLWLLWEQKILPIPEVLDCFHSRHLLELEYTYISSLDYKAVRIRADLVRFVSVGASIRRPARTLWYQYLSSQTLFRSTRKPCIVAIHCSPYQIMNNIRGEKILADVAFEKELSDHSHIENQALDPEVEKKLLRKVDLHLIPILFLIFLCAFIDRYGVRITQSFFPD